MAMLLMRKPSVGFGALAALRGTVATRNRVLSEPLQLLGCKGSFMRLDRGMASSGGASEANKPYWYNVAKLSQEEEVSKEELINAQDPSKSLEHLMERRFSEWGHTAGALSFKKDQLKKIIFERLNELSLNENPATAGVGVEMADCVHMLKVLGYTAEAEGIENIGKKAGDGALMLLEGDRKMTQGQKLLLSAKDELKDFILKNHC